jgi:DNA primase
VRKEGPDGILEYLSQAVDVLDRKLQILEEKDYFSSIERTRGAVDRLLPTLRAAKDPALKDIYVSKVADRTGVRRETLEAELAKRGTGGPARTRSRPPAEAQTVKPRPPAGPGAERKLLQLLVQSRDFIDRAVERLGPDEFSDPAMRAVFEALVEDPDLKHPPVDMDPGASARLEEFLANPERLSEASRVFEDALGQIKESQLAARAAHLRSAMAGEDDPSVQESMVRELEEIARLRREMKMDWRPAIRRRHDPNDPSRE